MFFLFLFSAYTCNPCLSFPYRGLEKWVVEHVVLISVSTGFVYICFLFDDALKNKIYITSPSQLVILRDNDQSQRWVPISFTQLSPIKKTGCFLLCMSWFRYLWVGSTIQSFTTPRHRRCVKILLFFSLSFVLLMERESRSHTRYFSQQFFSLASSAIRSHRLLLYMLDIFTLYTFFVCEEIAYISELKGGYKESNWPLRDSCCCCFLAGKWWWSFVMTTPWSLSL